MPCGKGTQICTECTHVWPDARPLAVGKGANPGVVPGGFAVSQGSLQLCPVSFLQFLVRVFGLSAALHARRMWEVGGNRGPEPASKTHDQGPPS